MAGNPRLLPLEVRDPIVVSAEDGTRVAVDVLTTCEVTPDRHGTQYFVAVLKGGVEGWCLSRLFHDADAATTYHAGLVKAAAEGQFVALPGASEGEYTVHHRECPRYLTGGVCPADSEDD